MQKIAIIAVSREGASVATTIMRLCSGEILERSDVAARWHDFDAFVFIGAMGICVRTIAPLVEDKHTDPAVVCVDSLGQHVIPVLSGHVGGANTLAEALSVELGARAVITTQSDLTGLWAIDTLDRRFGWHKQTSTDENRVIFAFVGRRPVALVIGVRDEGTDYLRSTCPPHVTIFSEEEWSDDVAGQFEAVVIVSCRKLDSNLQVPCLCYVPRLLTVGLGLAHAAAPADAVWGEIYADLCCRQHLHPAAIREFATIDVKADEPVVRFLQAEGFRVRFFTADQLAAVSVPTPSATVARHVGTPSVAEAAAILDSNNGHLIVTKQKGEKWTYAVAEVSPNGGHIEIVGAGPGDPDLISVRGRRMLEQADLILYAGSLVPKTLTDCHKVGAVVRSSADMTLEEQCALMKEHYDRGHLIVRLHTGDPCIFGAIQEQMAFFDTHGMHYHITPGISSFLAAAAELRSQFTIPERTQTIILTRGEGRTPMPEREKLHLLARSQSTMCIFLSAAIVDDVQRELLQEYPEMTPVAACYHLTWPDQRIYRGQLRDLSRIVHDNHLTLTTMLVVGEAIDNRSGLSELYSKTFTHLFRKASE